MPTLRPRSPRRIDVAKPLAARSQVPRSSQDAGYGALLEVKADDATVDVKFESTKVDVDHAADRHTARR